MSCFSCMSPRHRDVGRPMNHPIVRQSLPHLAGSTGHEAALACADRGAEDERCESSHEFTLRELAAATQNFKESNLVGEGGFGKVYKGLLPPGGEGGRAVAIKQLNRAGLQGSKEFLVECLMLIMLHHPNLVKLLGYCAEGDERLLVYEFMPQGSLESHLFSSAAPPGKEPLPWNARVKVALGVARGLDYLHNVADPPVIYRDLKSANILLDDGFNPKMSDFGLAKLGPVGGSTHVSTRVMGTYGYCAPEYAMSGKLTAKSDLYSYGVLLLELITGRRAFDLSKPADQQNLVAWSKPFLSDRRRFLRLADPALRRRFPLRAFYKLTVIALMCLTEKPHIRPASRDVAVALEHISSEPYVPEQPSPSSSSPPEEQTVGEDNSNKG